jgi:DNA-binding MarR family transcriptional regulator
MTRKPAPAAFYQADGYLPEASVAYLMRRVIASIGQAADRRFESLGLTNAQWVPLLKLHLGHGGTVAELARECTADAGAMTRLLDRLEAKGLIKRVRSTEDRRVVNLELTEDGVQAAERIPAVLCEVQNEHLAGFAKSEWQALKTYLVRMLENGRALQTRAQTNAAAGTESQAPTNND